MDSNVECPGIIPEPQLHQAIKYLGDANTGLTVETQDVTDNSGDGVTAGVTVIAYADTSGAGFAWTALADQNYGHS